VVNLDQHDVDEEQVKVISIALLDILLEVVVWVVVVEVGNL
jgi:hypothetical protein